MGRGSSSYQDMEADVPRVSGEQRDRGAEQGARGRGTQLDEFQFTGETDLRVSGVRKVV